MSARSVIVVGAGLAGLVAAYELVQVGYDVTILEARMRAGGRVLTLREGFPEGLYAEAGAESFYPVEPDSARRYITRFSLPIASPPPRSPGLTPLWYMRGSRLAVTSGEPDWPLALTAPERALGLRGMRERFLSPIVAELYEAARSNLSADIVAEYDRESFAVRLRRAGASPAAIELLRIAELDLIGEGADQYSAADVVGPVYNVMAWPRRLPSLYVIEGGNDRLPDAFASWLGARIRYGAAVEHIAQEAGGVRVGYRQAGRIHEIIGDDMICAIPCSVLRTIAVSPPFSAVKTGAIAAVPYASVCKVFLQVGRRFWLEQGLSGFAFTDLPVRYMWEATARQHGTRGILQTYTTGDDARALGAMNEDRRGALALMDATSVYPEIEAYLEGIVSKSWDNDPWARGAYAWFRPGQVRTLLSELARPEGRVHFAGEHTASLLLHGSMQGALESGIRAAREVIEANSDTH